MTQDAILSINPGTTTTRCAIYTLDGATLSLVNEQSLEHSEQELSRFAGIAEQLEFRAAGIQAFLEQRPQTFRLLACAGRGGMLTPVPAGIIAVNEALVSFALHKPVYHHASNLGAPLASRIACQHNAPAFIVDPVSVDEMTDVARVSGFSEIPRFSFVHALNIRACARQFAFERGKTLRDTTAVVAHLGAGFSIAAIVNGKIVDSTNRMESSPFSPERSGGLPTLPLVELCYSGQYEKDELLKKLYGNGGVFNYLGTKDMRKVETAIRRGDRHAKLIYDAMLYQVSKAIGAMASVAKFELDGIILTGGLSNSPTICETLTANVESIAPVTIYPGSNECLALAEGAARVLNGTEKAMTWPVRLPACQQESVE